MRARKQLFIEWELENKPHMYDKPKSTEYIDRQTLTHVIGNVDCPPDVLYSDFRKSMEAVAETLDLFPYFSLSRLLQFDDEIADGIGQSFSPD